MISSRECMVKDGKLWFLSKFKNMMAELDYSNDIVNFHGLTDKYIYPIDKVFQSDEGTGYFFSVNGAYSYVYNFKGKTITQIEIACNYDIDNNYAFIGENEKYILVFTRKMGKVVFVNKVNNSVCEEKYPNCVKGLCFNIGCAVGGKVYLFSQEGNQILEYDYGKKIWGVIDDLNYAEILSLYIQDDKIYVLSKNNYVCSFDYLKYKFESVAEIPYKEYGEIIVQAKSKLIIMPSSNNEFIFYDFDSHTWSQSYVWPKDVMFKQKRAHWSKFVGFCEDNTYIYFSNRTCNYFLRINKITGEFMWNKPSLNLLDSEDLRFIKENEMCLSDYLEYIIQFF